LIVLGLFIGIAILVFLGVKAKRKKNIQEKTNKNEE
jgi:uncharacterized membrane-anchored protein YhcB (DUF1043 family)